MQAVSNDKEKNENVIVRFHDLKNKHQESLT